MDTENKFSSVSVLGWTLVILALGLIIVPSYFQEGMFFDGLTYAAIGRHLSAGHGEFWAPYYTEGFDPFYMHPPLEFGILSFFFNVFGNHVYTEEVYNFIVLALTVLFISLIWKRSFPNHKRYSWFPVFIFSVCPVICWCYKWTMLENTLGLFLLVFVYCQLLGFEKKKY